MDREKISVYLDKKQIAALQSLTKETRVKMADYIREGIDLVLTKYQGEKKTGKRS